MAESITNRQIYSALTDVSVAIARIEGRVGNIENSNAELMKVVIKGNGKLPLTERVQALENRHCTEDADKAQIKKEVKEKREKWSTRTWALVSGSILIVIGQIFALVVLLLRTGGI